MLKKFLESFPVLFRRRKFLINPKFQFKYLGIVLLLVIIILFCTVQYINLTLRTTTLLENLSSLEVEAVTRVIFRTVVYICIIFVVIIIVLGIFVLHRIAGPLYVLDKMFKLVSDGDLTIQLRLRKGDELQELAKSFQTMVEKLRGYIKTDKEKIEEIKSVLNQIISEYDKISNQQVIEKLQDISLKLEDLYKDFKTDL